MNRFIKNFHYLGLSILLIGIAQPAEAEFALNFTKVLPTSQQSTTAVVGGSGATGQTSFLMAQPAGNGFQTLETVTDPSTGLSYYHMIVGTPADGFMQETFVQTGAIAAPMFVGCGGNTCSTNLNNMDPLGITGSYNTGNAETNPTGVIIREFMSDGEISSEFLKDQYARKPMITEMISATDANAFFQTDMRNSTYSDMNTPGTMVSTFSLPGSSFGDFDMSRDAQITNVTAGRYTYTNGSGPGGSKGTYNYFEGNATFAPDWSIYMDANDPKNVWTFSGNHP
jgi:hypothetical protein